MFSLQFLHCNTHPDFGRGGEGGREGGREGGEGGGREGGEEG